VTLRIDELDRSVVPDVVRLIEDVSATLPLIRRSVEIGRPNHPTPAIIQALGEAFLDDTPGGRKSKLTRSPNWAPIVDSWNLELMGGAVRLSYLVFSVVLGRKGLRELFGGRDGYQMSACLRWLVLHGMKEHQLLPYLSRGFARQLRRSSMVIKGRRLSPLQACIIGERTEVLVHFLSEPAESFEAYFDDWLLSVGVRDHWLAWVLTATETMRLLQRDPSGAAIGALHPPASTATPTDLKFPDGALDLGAHRPDSGNDLPVGYRAFGPDYGTFLDLDDPIAAARAFNTGTIRPGLRSGLEIVTTRATIALPNASRSGILVILTLDIPDSIASEYWVRLRAWDHPWSPSFVSVLSAAAFKNQPVLIPLVRHGVVPQLEIAFSKPGMDPGAQPAFLHGYAVVKALHVWFMPDDSGG
jgi:hypothetical protein